MPEITLTAGIQTSWKLNEIIHQVSLLSTWTARLHTASEAPSHLWLHEVIGRSWHDPCSLSECWTVNGCIVFSFFWIHQQKQALVLFLKAPVCRCRPCMGVLMSVFEMIGSVLIKRRLMPSCVMIPLLIFITPNNPAAAQHKTVVPL